MDFSDKLVQNLKPSELNSKFDYENLNFSAYISAVTQMLRAVKRKFALKVHDDKLLLNAPFEWQPKTKAHRGVLLIHGLFDTPYIMRDVGRHFCNQGFLVRSILLPGHGTVPADLLTTSSQEWIKATDYGVHSFKNEVEQLYLVGFSTGATLSLNYVLRNPESLPLIAGIIMLSPAFAINTAKSFAIRIYRMFRWLFRGNKWVLRPGYDDYTKYTSFPVNGVLMLQRLIVESNWLERKHHCDLPIFMALSEQDESVRPQAALKFFEHTTNPLNRLIYYSNQAPAFGDPRMQVIAPADPNEHILNYSHVCLPVAPDNPHYGKHGDYQEPIHEPDEKSTSQEVYYGAFDTENEKNYRLRRITYNPKFGELMQQIDEFMARSAR